MAATGTAILTDGGMAAGSDAKGGGTMVKQTAGRTALGDFAPKFAELNDDVLFGEVWSRTDKLPLKMRSVITVTALVSKGITDSSLKYHLESARKNGVTRTEMAEMLTHVAFYAGWPNAWAAFRMAKEVYADDGGQEAHGGFFGMGEKGKALRYLSEVEALDNNHQGIQQFRSLIVARL